MPTYTYECKRCGKRFDEVRRIKDRQEAAKCSCGGRADKVFTKPGGLCFGSFKEGYNKAFGKHFTTKNQLKEELARIKGETGQELVEVGNDKVSTKRQKKQVKWDEFGKELKAKWRKNG